MGEIMLRTLQSVRHNIEAAPDGMGGAGIGGGEPLATPAPGGQQGSIDPQPQQTAAQPVEKTFTQADLDRIIGERLARQERAHNEQLQTYAQQMAQYEQAMQQYAGAPTQQDEGEMPNEYVQRLSQLEDFYYEQQVNQMTQKLQAAHPEIAQDATLMDAIYNKAADLGVTDLEVAYWAVCGPQITQTYQQQLAAAEQEAIKKYVASKTQQPAAPEGEGGGVAPGAKKPTTWEEADKLTRELFRQSTNI